MHLYVISSELTTELPEISLQDGCTPIINGQKPELLSTEGDPIEVEPAVWYKVLILDSISIDCTQRAILWNCASAAETNMLNRDGVVSKLTCRRGRAERLESEHRLAESMYIGGECYGYHSDLDEVFDVAQQAMSQFADSRISGQKFHEVLFQLLHCYVLPAISLTKDDVKNLEEAHRLQEIIIENVDTEIIECNAKIDEVKKAMLKQRQRYVNELNESNSSLSSTAPLGSGYSLEFSQVLMMHICEDISEAWGVLDELQSGVQQAKKQSQITEFGAEGSCELISRRQSRDEFMVGYQNLLQAREALHENVKLLRDNEHKKKKKSRRHSKVQRVNPLHNVYVGMHGKVQDFFKDIRALTDKKVLLISVKVAIRSTLSDLLECDETCGIDVDRTGKHKATDVLRHSSVPKEWLTLTEQVSSLVTEPSCIFSKTHMDYCTDIVRTCAAAVREKKLIDMTAAALELAPKSASSSQRTSVDDQPLQLELTERLSVRHSRLSTAPVCQSDTKEPHDEENDSLSASSQEEYDVVESRLKPVAEVEHSPDYLCLSSEQSRGAYCDSALSEAFTDKINKERSTSPALFWFRSVEDDPVGSKDDGQASMTEGNVKGNHAQVVMVPGSHEVQTDIASSSVSEEAESQTVIPSVADDTSARLEPSIASGPAASESGSATDQPDQCLRRHKVTAARPATVYSPDEAKPDEVDEGVGLCPDPADGGERPIEQSSSSSSTNTNTCSTGSSYEFVEPDIPEEEQNRTSCMSFLFRPKSLSGPLLIPPSPSPPLSDYESKSSSLSRVSLEKVWLSESNSSEELTDVSNETSATTFTSVTDDSGTGSGGSPARQLSGEHTDATAGEGQSGLEGGRASFRSGKDYLVHVIEEMKESIAHHFDEIVKDIQETLNYTDPVYYRKIWLCYESHFYDEVMSTLARLYEQTYDPVGQNSTDLASTLSADDLGLQDSVLCHLLCELYDGSSPEQGAEPAKPADDEEAKTVTSRTKLESSMQCIQPQNKRECFSKHLSDEVDGGENISKAVKIHHPTTTTVIVDRRTWPLSTDVVMVDGAGHKHTNVGTWAGQEVLCGVPGYLPDLTHGCQRTQSRHSRAAHGQRSPEPEENHATILLRLPDAREANASSQTCELTSLKLKAVYKSRFAAAFACIDSMLQVNAPLLKLQHLTRCLREVSDQVADLQTQLFGQSLGACSDDLIDILVLLLVNSDGRQVAMLYAHIMLLADLMPPFFAGGPFSFSLVQFSVAYQFIQDKILLNRRKQSVL